MPERVMPVRIASWTFLQSYTIEFPFKKSLFKPHEMIVVLFI